MMKSYQNFSEDIEQRRQDHETKVKRATAKVQIKNCRCSARKTGRCC